MPEQADSQSEKISDEEIVEAVSEFYSTRPWIVLGQIARLQIDEGRVREAVIEEKPPVEIGTSGDLIPIDQCLGQYQPRSKRIILFSRGIEAAAELLKSKPEDLKQVVRYHEWAHAILHVGSDKDRHQCELRDYNRIDDRVHESIAQLLAWHAIEENVRKSRNHRVSTVWTRIKDAFARLEARQPPKYRNWRQLEKLSTPYLQKTLILIRRGTRFRDWEGLSALAQ